MEPKEKKSNKKLIMWMIGIFVMLPVIGLFASAWVTYSMPKLYESRAVVELVPSGADVEAWGVDQYVETEMEVVRSKESLILLAQMIQLDVRWGVPDYHAAEQLQRLVKVERVGKGRMLEITCRHRKKEEAQMICQAVYEAYRNRKADLRSGRAGTGLMALKQDNRTVGNRLDELELEYAYVTGKRDHWVGVKRDLETVKKEYESVKKKKKALELELTEASRPVHVMIVHEIPEISDYPVSPNIQLNLSRGLIAGFFAACVIDGLLLIPLLGNKKGT